MAEATPAFIGWRQTERPWPAKLSKAQQTPLSLGRVVQHASGQEDRPARLVDRLRAIGFWYEPTGQGIQLDAPSRRKLHPLACLLAFGVVCVGPTVLGNVEVMPLVPRFRRHLHSRRTYAERESATLEAVMNSIRNGLGMRETEIAKEPSRPWNPHFYAIFTQVHNTL